MGQDTLMESAAVDFRCRECEGVGSFAVRLCSHQGNCPCGAGEAQCEVCAGTGVEPCQWCGERPATDLSPAEVEMVCRCCLARAVEVVGG